MNQAVDEISDKDFKVVNIKCFNKQLQPLWNKWGGKWKIPAVTGKEPSGNSKTKNTITKTKTQHGLKSRMEMIDNEVNKSIDLNQPKQENRQEGGKKKKTLTEPQGLMGQKQKN